MNITLRQLRIFAVVAQELSFTSAAAKISLTQSALTAAVRTLEAELGLRLFARTTRSVRLTAEGQQFLAVTQRLLGDMDASFENMKAIAARMKGNVVVSAAESFLRYVVCPAVAKLAAVHPGISVRLLEQTTDSAMNAVLGGEVDFAIASLIKAHPAISGVTILRDRFGVLSSPRSGHLRDRVVRWEMLDAGSYVGLNASNGIRQLIDRDARVPAAFRSPRYEAGSTAALAAVLREGFGFGIVPALAARAVLDQELVFVPLERPRLFRDLQMIKRKDHGLSPSAQALLEQVAAALSLITPTAEVKLLLDRVMVQRFGGQRLPPAAKLIHVSSAPVAKG